MNTIKCPNCQTPIEIEQVLAQQIEQGLIQKFSLEREKLQQSQLLLQQQLAQLKQKNEEELETSLKQQEQKIKTELWTKAQQEAERKISESHDKEFRDLRQQLQEKDLRAQKAEKEELQLRKKQRELEEEKRQLAITVEREIDKRIQEERAKTSKLEADRFSLKEKEYQKQLEDMKALVDEARRKGDTVSQQLQGEVLELELERMLREQFPADIISEVKKGQFGADLLQTVRNSFGRTVGIIVWESKQTENFSDKWLPKLREDCRNCHGSVAVLVTRTLPAGIETCGERDRVWITGIDFVVPLAGLLRQTLLKVEQEKTAQSGKDVKTEMLYNYINSQEFRGRVEAIVESFREMKDDLDKEQRALQNSWRKREKQILRLATNTAYMYGEMQGLVGTSLPNIHGLELESGTQARSKSLLNSESLPSETTSQNELF